MKIHKTCPTWGITVCNLSLFDNTFLETSYKWENVSCRKCLKKRIPRVKKENFAKSKAIIKKLSSNKSFMMTGKASSHKIDNNIKVSYVGNTSKKIMWIDDKGNEVKI